MATRSSDQQRRKTRIFLRPLLLLISIVLSLVALNAQRTQRVNADPFAALIEQHVTYTQTDQHSTPGITFQFNIDCPGGVCPATSSAPFFDVLFSHYTANIHNCRSQSPAPCTGMNIPTDALIGSAQLHWNTNTVLGNVPDNVSATTGVAAGCGGAGTSPVNTTLNLVMGANSATDVVSGKDGPDADAVADTQGDVRGTTPQSGPNGEYDGADALPDYLKLSIDAALPLVVNRAFGVAKIAPGAPQTDVNIVTLDLTTFGAGNVAVLALGDTRSVSVVDANLAQSTKMCAPFSATINLPPAYADNPNTIADESVGAMRLVVANTGGTVAMHYGTEISGTEDVDGDASPAVVDRCDNPDVGLFPSSNTLTSATGATDTDGDGLGDSCDPDPATRDNCPGAAFVGKSTACNGAGANPATYPTKTSGCTTNPQTTVVTCANPWNPDQDIDGDNFPNWGDNCPTVYNPQQVDRNGDGIGDLCQSTHPTVAGPRPDRPAHEHDDFCDSITTVGGPGTTTTTCYGAGAHAFGMADGTVAAGKGSVQDTNDDGFADYLEVDGFNFAEGSRFSDRNNDSDADGCSDYAEMHGAPGTACAGDPRVADSAGGSCTWSNATTHFLPVSPGVPSGSCVDGNKDRDNNLTADWIDDVNLSPQQPVIDPDNGSPDSDGDGCSNRREQLPAAPISAGGGRDALNKWDFFDVDTNTGGVLAKNHVVSIADTIAVLAYVGANAANPFAPNAGGKTYAGDDNNDGVPNSEVFDRSPAGSLSGPPNGAVSIADAIANLNQIGANCSTM